MNPFYKKKILIYGLGKSGLSASKFLKKNNHFPGLAQISQNAEIPSLFKGAERGGGVNFSRPA